MTPLTTSEVRAPKALDIQHDTDPARDHGPAKHIPHIGHALLFFALAWLLVNLCQLAVVLPAHLHTEQQIKAHPGLLTVGQAISYVLTLVITVWMFPKLWDQSFSRGIEWNWLAVRRWWYWMAAGGVVLSALAQFGDHFIQLPQDSPVDAVLGTTHGAWLMTAFGVILAPLVEEIAFRGFLLPALAIAYDWLALERTPAGMQRWQSSTLNSRASLVFAAIFSSAPFALLHGAQLDFVWRGVAVLYGVSLVLSIVRIRLHSVAASVVLHAVYNLSVFVVLFIGTDGYRHMDKMLH